MNQGYGKSKHAERLIQHAIEVFDLVEITPAAMTGETVNHRFLQASVSLLAAQHGKMENVTAHIASITPSFRAGSKIIARQRALALNSRVC